MGIFTVTTFASIGEDTQPDTELLIVNAAWIDGETIRIDVTDPQIGTRSAIAVPLSEHLREGENIKFIAIQAVDLDGRQSEVIEIRNPFFNPNLPQGGSTSDTTENTTGNEADDTRNTNSPDNGHSVSSIEPPNTNLHLRPLTPDGTGTVTDNVTDSDGGREFFTIFSEDGNEFFLIIDRHRNVDNVYFLNAVTEEDLMALARRSGREIESSHNNSVSAIPTPPYSPEAVEPDLEDCTPSVEPEPTEERPTAFSRIGNNLLVFGGIVAVVGGLAYYVKVVRPRKSGFSDGYDDEPDDYDYDDAVDEDVYEEDGGDD